MYNKYEFKIEVYKKNEVILNYDIDEIQNIYNLIYDKEI